MPRRNAKDGGHTVFTDHRIQRVPETPQELPANSGIAAWREPAADLQKRNLGIAYIDVGMQRHAAPFVIQGYRTLTEVQEQFANDSALFKWIGEALLLGKQTADAKVAFELALQLEPNSALTEASAASPYIEEGNDAEAIAHLERAVALDPLLLPAASTLIRLYEKQGEAAEASALSARIKRAMDAQSSGSQTDLAADTRKRSEEVYKNIQLLKGVPAEQLPPAMQFIASSLGVKCSFCHVENHFEKDDKKPKQTAREMMKMMFAINGTNFDSDREVTCYSCHRGAPRPIDTPVLGSGVQPIAASTTGDEQKLPKNLPSTNWLVNKYIEALGGAEALQKITSRVGTGSTTVSGRNVKVELFIQSPGKRALIQHREGGESVEVFDGREGWFTFPGRSPQDMHRPEIEAAQMDADLQFPLHIQRVFPELRVEYPENVGGRELRVLLGIRGDQPGAKFYFDEQSGLLARVVRYGESPLGLNPSQIDYGNYREVDGVQVPFQVTVSDPGRTLTIQFEEIRQNVPIAPERFMRPPVDRPSADAPAPKPPRIRK